MCHSDYLLLCQPADSLSGPGWYWCVAHLPQSQFDRQNVSLFDRSHTLITRHICFIFFAHPVHTLFIPLSYPFHTLFIPFSYPVRTLFIPFSCPFHAFFISLWIPHTLSIPLSYPFHALFIPFSYPFSYHFRTLFMPFSYPFHSRRLAECDNVRLWCWTLNGDNWLRWWGIIAWCIVAFSLYTVPQACLLLQMEVKSLSRNQSINQSIIEPLMTYPSIDPNHSHTGFLSFAYQNWLKSDQDLRLLLQSILQSDLRHLCCSHQSDDCHSWSSSSHARRWRRFERLGYAWAACCSWWVPTHCGTHWQGPSNCQRQCVLVHMGNRDPLSEHYNWRLDWNQAYSYGNDIENYDRSCPRLSIKRLPKWPVEPNETHYKLTTHFFWVASWRIWWDDVTVSVRDSSERSEMQLFCFIERQFEAEMTHEGWTMFSWPACLHVLPSGPEGIKGSLLCPNLCAGTLHVIHWFLLFYTSAVHNVFLRGYS